MRFSVQKGGEGDATEVICESLQLGAKPQGTVPAASTTAAQYAAAKGRDIPRNTASAPNEDVPF